MDDESTYFDDFGHSASCFPDRAEPVYVSGSGMSMISMTHRDGMAIAVKSLKPEYRGNAFHEGALAKEAAVMSGLDHPNICKYMGYEDIPGYGNSLLLQWVEGQTLSSLIANGLTRRLMDKIFLQICDALEYIHSRQIVHRDLKPDNIIISRNGQDVKMIDFGFSDADYYSAYKMPAGTPGYAAPEQRRGEAPDVRSDIWALGMIVSDMAQRLGKPAFRRWNSIIGRCLMVNPDERFQSANEAREAFIRAGRKRKAMPAAVCAGALSLIALCVIWMSSDRYGRMRENRQARKALEEVTRTILQAGGAESIDK